jgi:putative restriction endonuclease
MATQAKSKPVIGPRHHGRKMSLKAFEFAEVQEGYLVELARGYLVVSDEITFAHSMQSAHIRGKLDCYHYANPTSFCLALDPASCKLLIPEWESERHPDIAVYLSKPKGKKDRTMWRTWIPELVIEIASETSRDRDYTGKRDEYWTLGVKEYWIVDAKLKQVLVLRRGRSQWTERTLGPTDTCETKLLPGFKLPVKAVFDAAGEEGGE